MARSKNNKKVEEKMVEMEACVQGLDSDEFEGKIVEIGDSGITIKHKKHRSKKYLQTYIPMSNILIISCEGEFEVGSKCQVLLKAQETVRDVITGQMLKETIASGFVTMMTEAGITLIAEDSASFSGEVEADEEDKKEKAEKKGTGKRGRPAKKVVEESEDEDDEDESEDEDDEDESEDEDDDDDEDEDSDDDDEDDEDEDEDEDEDDDEPVAPKKRGRPSVKETPKKGGSKKKVEDDDDDEWDD